MNDLLLQAKAQSEKGDLLASLETLNTAISSDGANVEALLLRGMIYYRMQKWGDAINDFASVLENNPDHAEAKSRMEMAKSILGYFTPDMFNP